MKTKISLLLFIKMASRNSIKLFHLNQKFCQAICIYVPESNLSRFVRSIINWTLFICMIQFSSTSGAFMLYDAKSMGEYGSTCMALLCDNMGTAIYCITLGKVADFSKFIQICDEFIEKRKHWDRTRFDKFGNNKMSLSIKQSEWWS